MNHTHVSAALHFGCTDPIFPHHVTRFCSENPKSHTHKIACFALSVSLSQSRPPRAFLIERIPNRPLQHVFLVAEGRPLRRLVRVLQAAALRMRAARVDEY